MILEQTDFERKVRRYKNGLTVYNCTYFAMDGRIISDWRYFSLVGIAVGVNLEEGVRNKLKAVEFLHEKLCVPGVQFILALDNFEKVEKLKAVKQPYRPTFHIQKDGAKICSVTLGKRDDERVMYGMDGDVIRAIFY